MGFEKSDPAGEPPAGSDRLIPLSDRRQGRERLDVGGSRGDSMAKSPRERGPYSALATGATSGVMRRIETRRFCLLLSSVATFRYCSP